ncbi:LuxR C-terminal-related transcriptional regulator [Roseiarcus sp.]|uniref:LuxR C-terminal-related transcriptional regulator n=1 Tax=Roseiarcus sp. TaxID=1969460 RepID=UPI003F9572A5
MGKPRAKPPGERERRVLALMALDQSNKEVERSLMSGRSNISTETVKTHLKKTFVKLDV